MSAGARRPAVVDVTFVSDMRGRVPFAFLGALLVLSSTLYAATAAPNPVMEPVSDEVVDEAQTSGRMALATAIREAGRDAAGEPVLERGDTELAKLLSSRNTFRSYLELRIALEARRTLGAAQARSGSLSANVSLPAIHDVDDLDAAMANVTIHQVSEHRYRVEFSNLLVTLRRHGRPVDRFTYNTSVTVRVPVLRLHHRTERFESRLHRGIQQPGFGRDLTTRIFAITWARGYAQYGGAPIANVLANRHIEVMANDALLAQQAAVFGVEDSRGRRLTRRAVTNVALRGAFRGAEEGLKSAISRSNRDGAGSDGGTSKGSAPSVPLPSVYDSESSYDVDHSADRAFLRFVEGDASPDLASVVDAVYRADVRAATSSRFVDSETSYSGHIPPNATHFLTQHDTDRWLRGGSWTDGSGTRLREFDGTVVVEEQTTRFYASNYSLGITTDTHRSEYDVSITLRCRYRSPGPAPDRPIDRCPFGQTAHDRLTDAAMDDVISHAGGVDSLAVAAVEGDDGTGWHTVDISPPEPARREAYEGTADLRSSARDVSVSLQTRSIASSANPASVLADTLEEDTDRLLDTPSRYGSARERAVAAARTVYLDQLVGTLRSRSPLVDRAQQELAGELTEHAIPTAPPEGRRHSLSTLASGIDADPAYLSLAARGSDPSMAARNVNIFAVPYGDAADVISEQVDGGTATVSLRTAAQTLAVLEAEGTHPDAERDLRRAVSDSLDDAKDRYRSTLADEVGSGDARRAVDGGFRQWGSVSGRALAVTDGRMAGAIASNVGSEISDRKRDTLEVELRVVSNAIREDRSIRIDESVVESAVGATDSETSQIAKAGMNTLGTDVAKKAWKRATGTKTSRLPAGLPLLPVPGSWYATVNAWTVSVQGSYDTFTVRADRAAPGRTENGTIAYVRTDETVTIDLDGDGNADVLGHNRPVTFAADTGVVIVVPPGKSGVGDVDGNADERSPGWGD